MTELQSTYYTSPIGTIRISGTPTYIAEVHFMKDDEAVAPSENIPALLIECTEQLIQYFNGQLRSFNVPLAQPGTPFQQEVWNLLTQIPFGKTISYQHLANQSGDTKATRAVANANGKNNIAIIVPCHRVIGSSGALTGYAAGVWRKKWLLEHEAKLAHGVQVLF